MFKTTQYSTRRQALYINFEGIGLVIFLMKKIEIYRHHDTIL